MGFFNSIKDLVSKVNQLSQNGGAAPDLATLPGLTSNKLLQGIIARLSGSTLPQTSQVPQTAGNQDQLILAFTALGMATAYADGDASEEEILEIDEFIFNLTQELTPALREKIILLRKNPPSFEEALVEVRKLPATYLPDFRSMIVAIINSDGSVHEKEKNFLARWDALFQS